MPIRFAIPEDAFVSAPQRLLELSSPFEHVMRSFPATELMPKGINATASSDHTCIMKDEVELSIFKANEATSPLGPRRIACTSTRYFWLAQSVIALVASFIHNDNSPAAIRRIVDLADGAPVIETFVIDMLILVNDDYALSLYSTIFLSMNYDPGPLAADKWLNIQCKLSPRLYSMAQAFVSSADMTDDSLSVDLRGIIADLADCVSISQGLEEGCLGECNDIALRRWIFLRQNAVIARFLNLRCVTTLHDCCRLALLLWHFKVKILPFDTKVVKDVVTRLKQSISQLDGEDDSRGRLIFLWIASVGAMSTVASDVEEWFSRRATAVAIDLAIEIEEDSLRRCLRQFFFLQCEDVHVSVLSCVANG